MALPQIPNICRSRDYIQEFRGYNHNLRIAENEFYDELNLSADNYPVLSTRKSRGNKACLEGTILGAVGHGEDIYYVTNAGQGVKIIKISKNDHRPLCYINSEKNDCKERKLLFFGAWLLVFPDCYSYNTVGGEKGPISQNVSTENPDCEIVLQYPCEVENGVDYTAYDGIIATESEMSRNPDKYRGSMVACVDADTNQLLWIGTAQYTEDGNEWWCDYDISDKFRLHITFSRKIDIVKLGINFSKLGMLSKSSLATTFDAYESEDELIWGEDKDGKTFACLDGYAMPYNKIKIVDGRFHGVVKKSETSGGGKMFRLDDKTVITVEEKRNLVDDFMFDYVIECQNRLWACCYGKNKDGEMVNEIFCSAWGTFNEWNYHESPAAASFIASIGTPGPFTGATVVNQNPVFFKEDYVHKVYVSSAGDHQIVTLNCPGVEEGSSKSIAHVNGYLMYKTRDDVVIFDGSVATPISTSFGDAKYKNAIAGASESKYVMCATEKNTSNNVTLVYDTNYGIWHKEDYPGGICDMTLCDGRLCMVTSKGIYTHDDNTSDERVDFMFETGAIGFSSPDKKYISRIDLRVSLFSGTYVQIFMQYDSDGIWVSSGSLLGMESIPKHISLPILPRRCDHFKLRVSGNGAFNLYSITKVLEQGE